MTLLDEAEDMMIFFVFLVFWGDWGIGGGDAEDVLRGCDERRRGEQDVPSYIAVVSTI
jgi:hypothetical protein